MSRMAPKCPSAGPEFFLTSKYIFRMFLVTSADSAGKKPMAYVFLTAVGN